MELPKKYLELLIEDRKIKSDINFLLLTNKKEGEKLSDTAEKFKEYCEKNKIEHYIAFAEEAYITDMHKDKKEYRIHNIDDKEGFLIDKDKTCCLVRGGIFAEKTAPAMLLKQLEEQVEIFCVNTSECIKFCANKYLTTFELQNAGLPVPENYLLNPDNVDTIVKKLGNTFPIVIKALYGCGGAGVFLIETERSMKSILQAIWKLNPNAELLAQEYIDTDSDLRIHILGNKVIGAMKRNKLAKDFRSNYSLGSTVEEIEIDDNLKEMCIKAAKVAKGTWLGADIIYDKKKNPYFIELNSSPGTEGFQSATHINIIKLVMEYMLDKNNWKYIPKQIGYTEVLNFPNIGNFSCKMDVGNTVRSSIIHCDKWELSKDKKWVDWEINGKKIKSKFIEMRDFSVGVRIKKTEERPVVLLDIEFLGKQLNDLPFGLGNRLDRVTPVLLNRQALTLLNVTVNPSWRYLVTNSNDKEELKAKK